MMHVFGLNRDPPHRGLKDGKFDRPEADGIRTLIAGLCASTADDDERLRRDTEIFEDLHRHFAAGPRRA